MRCCETNISEPQTLEWSIAVQDSFSIRWTAKQQTFVVLGVLMFCYDSPHLAQIRLSKFWRPFARWRLCPGWSRMQSMVEGSKVCSAKVRAGYDLTAWLYSSSKRSRGEVAALFWDLPACLTMNLVMCLMLIATREIDCAGVVFISQHALHKFREPMT